MNIKKDLDCVKSLVCEIGKDVSIVKEDNLRQEGLITQNQDNITSNKEAIDTNTTDIEDLKKKVKKNTDDISDLSDKVKDNTDLINTTKDELVESIEEVSERVKKTIKDISLDRVKQRILIKFEGDEDFTDGPSVAFLNDEATSIELVEENNGKKIVLKGLNEDGQEEVKSEIPVTDLIDSIINTIVLEGNELKFKDRNNTVLHNIDLSPILRPYILKTENPIVHIEKTENPFEFKAIKLDNTEEVITFAEDVKKNEEVKTIFIVQYSPDFLEIHESKNRAGNDKRGVGMTVEAEDFNPSTTSLPGIYYSVYSKDPVDWIQDDDVNSRDGWGTLYGMTDRSYNWVEGLRRRKRYSFLESIINIFVIDVEELNKVKRVKDEIPGFRVKSYSTTMRPEKVGLAVFTSTKYTNRLIPSNTQGTDDYIHRLNYLTDYFFTHFKNENPIIVGQEVKPDYYVKVHLKTGKPIVYIINDEEKLEEAKDISHKVNEVESMELRDKTNSIKELVLSKTDGSELKVDIPLNNNINTNIPNNINTQNISTQSITSNRFIRNGGTSEEILLADGSVITKTALKNEFLRSIPASVDTIARDQIVALETKLNTLIRRRISDIQDSITELENKLTTPVIIYDRNTALEDNEYAGKIIIAKRDINFQLDHLPEGQSFSVIKGMNVPITFSGTKIKKYGGESLDGAIGSTATISKRDFIYVHINNID